MLEGKLRRRISASFVVWDSSPSAQNDRLENHNKNMILPPPPSKRFWHFAISAKPILWPCYAYAIRSHVVFSGDGHNIWEKSDRMHRARRSQCKDWWNDDWRDRILCFMHWLKGLDESVHIKVGANKFIQVSPWPLSFTSPVSYKEPKGRLTMSIIEQFKAEQEPEEGMDENNKDA